MINDVEVSALDYQSRRLAFPSPKPLGGFRVHSSFIPPNWMKECQDFFED